MKISKEQAKQLEELIKKIQIDAYLDMSIKRPGMLNGYAPTMTTYGCGCCSKDFALTESEMDVLIDGLKDALDAAETIRGMFGSGELKYGEILETDAEGEDD